MLAQANDEVGREREREDSSYFMAAKIYEVISQIHNSIQLECHGEDIVYECGHKMNARDEGRQDKDIDDKVVVVALLGCKQARWR